MTAIPDEYRPLFDFIGYGRLEAPYWFIGMEEGTAGHNDLAHNLAARRRFPVVIDSHRAHAAEHMNYPVSEWSRMTPVWTFAANIASQLSGQAVDPWNDLGRAHGDTLLAELMPLPKPDKGTWPDVYQDAFGPQDGYVSKYAPWRLRMLLGLVERHQPQLVWFYGKEHWSHLEGIARWSTVPDTRDRAQVARVDATWFVRSTFFGNGALSYANVSAAIAAISRS